MKRQKLLHRKLLTQRSNGVDRVPFIHKFHSFSLGKLWITFTPATCPPRLFSSVFFGKIPHFSKKSLWISL